MHIIKRTLAVAAHTLSLTFASMAILSSSSFAQSIPDLGSAEPFSVLAGSTVTNTGSSIVTGELGVSPGTAITGFPPGIVRLGQIRSNDSVAAQAVADLLLAYNNLKGQAVDTEQAAAMGMGMVLVPGVYHFSDAADITGTLVLDAQGSTSAVWVFQVEEALTVASNAEVTLINGATASSVFWQIGTSATLGTSSRFSGSILAGAGITLNTGAVLIGRALAQTAVTLDTNTVTITGAPNIAVPPVATALPTLVDVGTIDGGSTTAVIKAGASSDNGASYQYTFSASEEITVTAALFPEIAHLNQAASVFVVIKHTPPAGSVQWIFKNEAGTFTDWNQDVNMLQPVYASTSMGASISGEVFSGVLPAGIYEVYVGYTAAGDPMIYSESPLSFVVTTD